MKEGVVLWSIALFIVVLVAVVFQVASVSTNIIPPTVAVMQGVELPFSVVFISMSALVLIFFLMLVRMLHF